MSIFSVSNEIQNLLMQAEEEDIPPEAVADTLEALYAEFRERADTTACVIKNLTAEAEAIKAEAANMQKRAKAKQKLADSLKAMLSDALIQNGLGSLETARNKLTFRKSSVVDCDTEKFVEWAMFYHRELLTFKDPEPDKKAIREAINTWGEEVPYARITEKQNLQIK